VLHAASLTPCPEQPLPLQGDSTAIGTPAKVAEARWLQRPPLLQGVRVHVEECPGGALICFACCSSIITVVHRLNRLPYVGARDESAVKHTLQVAASAPVWRCCCVGRGHQVGGICTRLHPACNAGARSRFAVWWTPRSLQRRGVLEDQVPLGLPDAFPPGWTLAAVCCC
jgi:hypothetical protein